MSKLAFSSWTGPCKSPAFVVCFDEYCRHTPEFFIFARWVHNPRAKEMAGAIKKELGQLKSVMSAFAFPGLPRPDICRFSIWCLEVATMGMHQAKTLTGNRAANWVAVYFIVLPSNLW